jgi:hypothetical protein
VKDEIAYDEACNYEPFHPVEQGSDEHKALMLTVEEGAELAALWRKAGVSILTEAEMERTKHLSERSLLYGQHGVEAQPFVGLEPRYTINSGSISLRQLRELNEPPEGNIVTEWLPAPNDGLPRFLGSGIAGDDPSGLSRYLYHVAWGEELQMREPDPNRPKPSRWQRLKWWAEYVATEALDFLAECWWRLSKAWRALRHG